MTGRQRQSKVLRELGRAGRRLGALPGVLSELLVLRWLHERKIARQKRVHTGRVPIGAEVAIYLVHAPGGLQPSHHSVVAQIRAHGIAPLVVSNHPLSDKDRTQVLAHAALLIERPNIGYDFGGYRDGVLELAGHLPRLDRLYILNDSVWMIDAPRSWFDEVRALGVDVTGATSHYGVKRDDAVNFRDFAWVCTPDNPNFHYASYALAFGARVLRDPDFLGFWHRLRLSNHKRRTVRRGEIGLTRWAISRGWSHKATCDVAGLEAELDALDDGALDLVVRHLFIREDPVLEGLRDQVLSSDPSSAQGRRDRRQIILITVARGAMAYAMPYFTLGYRGFQFVKKSPLWLSQSGAATMTAILEDLTGPMGRQAALEARALRRTGQARKDVPDAPIRTDELLEG